MTEDGPGATVSAWRSEPLGDTAGKGRATEKERLGLDHAVLFQHLLPKCLCFNTIDLNKFRNHSIFLRFTV